jgi:hypothetical protein
MPADLRTIKCKAPGPPSERPLAVSPIRVLSDLAARTLPGPDTDAIGLGEFVPSGGRLVINGHETAGYPLYPQFPQGRATSVALQK